MSVTRNSTSTGKTEANGALIVPPPPLPQLVLCFTSKAVFWSYDGKITNTSQTIFCSSETGYVFFPGARGPCFLSASDIHRKKIRALLFPFYSPFASVFILAGWPRPELERIPSFLLVTRPRTVARPKGNRGRRVVI